MARVYFLLAIIGAVLPLAVFLGWVGNLPPYGDSLIAGFFPNRAAGAATADVLYAIGVFWIWAFIDARRAQCRSPLEIVPIAGILGLCAALPWYLYLRESRET